ncbi:MAG: NUDIX hydrolase [Kastovskya adunca ATA6-11-RM4]|jgi:8-oxo-dGTP pyrophosphatase MutT (NUDIX family)|nr:NUDIX hydrolase [Kastovskya adunca ATA6-11-RM4]
MGYIQELRALVGHRPLIIPGAAVLIAGQQNGLLLQQRKDNQQWGLIGGSMEVGESLEETARREALEETGLELDELEWFGLFSGQELIYKCPNGDIVVNVVAVYIARQFRGRLKADEEEANEIRFFELRELPKNLSPPDRPVIEQYLRSFNGSYSAG